MQMGHGLSPVAAVVDHKAESGFRNAFGPCDVRSGKKEAAQQGGIVRPGFGHPRNRPLRNHENVDRCLRRDIPKGQAIAVLKNNVGGNFAGGNFFEKRHDSWR